MRRFHSPQLSPNADLRFPVQFNIACSDTGCQRKLEVDDENKLCAALLR